MTKVADAIRKVTAAMQRALDSGERSRAIDAEDLMQVLLAVADKLDPPGTLGLSSGELVGAACPACGERNPTC